MDYENLMDDIRADLDEIFDEGGFGFELAPSGSRFSLTVFGDYPNASLSEARRLFAEYGVRVRIERL